MNTKPKPHHSTPQMPVGTKKFLQKLIDKQTASVDMTRHGFVNESHPMQLFLKPLKTQIQKIHGKSVIADRSKLNDKINADNANGSTPIICKYIEEKKLERKKKRKRK